MGDDPGAEDYWQRRRKFFAGFVCIEYVWTEIWDCNRTENTMEVIRFRDWLRDADAQMAAAEEKGVS